MSIPANDTCVPDVTHDEVLAYVAGGLTPRRRRAVEGFLACNPDLAARVMTGLHMRGPAAEPARRRTFGMRAALAAMAACAISASAGWSAASIVETGGWRELDGDAPPEYVEEAAESRQATRVRAAMASQAETPTLDAMEIQRTLRLNLPRLPAGWRVVDVQVFPTDDGPSVNLVLEAPGHGRLDLFAVRADTLSTAAAPELATRGREAVAFWEKADGAFVLSGPGSRAQLLRSAAELSGATSL